MRSILGCITSDTNQTGPWCLYPSANLLSKNQLAKESPDSVAPVVNAALAPTLDKSLKGDKSLCPVRALRYHLGRTSDLRHNKELVFQERFRQGHLSCHHLLVNQATVILCYEFSDQQALTLHQVKAHDIRAFAASKAFQSGVSLEQSSQPATVSHISPSHSSQGCG